MEDFLNDEHFTSFSLTDFDKYFLENDVEIPDEKQYRVLIDIANGHHMKDLIQSSKAAKQKYGDQIILMVGNVKPNDILRLWFERGSIVRIGIGNGGGCLTTVQTGVGYPMASLISECNDIKRRNPFIKTKIVADGGFKNTLM